MRTRERPAAHLAVDRHPVREHLLDLGRRLPIAQLTAVVIPLTTALLLVDTQPAEEDVARRLHPPLPDDDTLAVVFEFARPRVFLEHRRLRFLDLEEEQILPHRTQQQRYPGLVTDAADTNYLVRKVDQVELIQQRAAVRRQGFAIRFED